MQTLKRNDGQFVPISAMVMFTMVVLMVAMVNVYKISRAKLKVQNLADAAALNLASQQAQAFNLVADRNEWLNHMVEGIPSPSNTDVPNVADCTAFNAANQKLIPGISCVENPYSNNSNQVRSRHIFNSKDGAANYASVVQTVNQAQQLFVDAYNSFLGDRSRMARSASSAASPSNFSGLLKSDIPELEDPGTSLVAWNSNSEEPQQESVGQLQDGIRSKMQGLKFKPHHDIQLAYYKKRCLGPFCVGNAYVEKTTLGELMFGKGSGQEVGYMVPDWNATPKISVQSAGGSNGPQVGVGVLVKRTIKLPIVGAVSVTAKSKAYVVSSSGDSGESGNIPKFKPTFWSKLAN